MCFYGVINTYIVWAGVRGGVPAWQTPAHPNIFVAHKQHNIFVINIYFILFYVHHIFISHPGRFNQEVYILILPYIAVCIVSICTYKNIKLQTILKKI